ncbi:alpha/beta hydrolase [Saccharopolyspora sp. K220]|uniref:alpha/beta fold hydrolase n=1 Tax=Saccharopolyspora soli TaxID=2926618 RepID=UPI001F55EC60|nr:alpha/beta hydrolase [Saccharopolyspora soli]MCI2416409.1 alpha/beta hydrolase [Saccharopolyspora soli]
MNDVLVKSAAVEIAVRDHGGSGPAVLLLHGAGGNLLAWEHLAPLLTATHRVLAVDLRGHGHSGDGPWNWDAVLDDLDAVAEHFASPSPAVVGHSLGGMIAGMWAVRHPDCPAAMSLDGHRAAATHPDNYVGMPTEQVHAQLARLREVFATQTTASGQPMSAEQVAALLDQQAAFATQLGIDAEHWVAMTQRGLSVHNGQTWPHPGPAVLEALRDASEFADALPIFQRITGPFQLVRATRLAGFPPEFTDLMQALHAGLSRDLAALTAKRPNVTVREIDASHGMLFEKPHQVAEIVQSFLSGTR